MPVKDGSGADTGPVGFRLSGQTQRYLFSILKIHHSYRKNNSDRAHTPRTPGLHIIHAEMEQTFKKNVGAYHPSLPLLRPTGKIL